MELLMDLLIVLLLAFCFWHTTQPWPFCHLWTVIFLHLHTGPFTLWLPIFFCPKWGMYWHFATCPHIDYATVYPLHPVLLGLSSLHKDQASGNVTPWMHYVPVCTLPILILLWGSDWISQLDYHHCHVFNVPNGLWPTLSLLRRNISVSTYQFPHSGVTSGSSSNMGNISAFCHLSSCRSFYGLSSTKS